VTAGEELGPIRVRGGVVSGIAGASLAAPVPIAGQGRVTRIVQVDPAAAFPPFPGERIGSIVVEAGGLRQGVVPLVAAALPAPDPVEGSWWSRAGSAVVRAIAGTVRALAG
jgi:hypothetical protein